MTEVLEKLYFMVEDRVGQYELADEETRSLEVRLDALQNEIILRLGEDGQELMEALADLNLKLEIIHDQALFRASMRLGTQIAGDAPLWDVPRFAAGGLCPRSPLAFGVTLHPGNTSPGCSCWAYRPHGPGMPPAPGCIPPRFPW